ncbi:MAG: TfoX/Sxy family protein [Candidatus Firestonebacteria bacterium]|nr:TfoX/Sxy family protein [Candidatus Firestonebacteria bacterium]
MASDKEFVDYILDQMASAGGVSCRKMFGEYAVYRNGKVVALVCDNQLFIKPTPGGKAFIGAVTQAPPYTGAKQFFLIEDKLDDREWLSELVRITTAEVPRPKLKTKRTKHPIRG